MKENVPNIQPVVGASKNLFQGKDDHLQKCIRNCLESREASLRLIPHCLLRGGEHAAQAHISLLMDCAEICGTAADFMIRMSPHHQRTCGICAEVCQACAEDCEKFEDDEMMKHVAELCRRCADSCREMSASAH